MPTNSSRQFRRREFLAQAALGAGATLPITLPSPAAGFCSCSGNNRKNDRHSDQRHLVCG
jgi:hypothetical protein